MNFASCCVLFYKKVKTVNYLPCNWEYINPKTLLQQGY